MNDKLCTNPEPCSFKQIETKRCFLSDKDCKYQKLLSLSEIITEGKRVLAEAEALLKR